MYVARCWNAIRDTRQSRPVLPSWTLLVNWAVCNDLPLSSSTRQSYLFATDSGRGLLQLVDILNTLFNILSGQLTFITETFELLTKSYAKLISYLWIPVCNCTFTVKNKSFKFKLLLYNISCFNEMCRICCMNTHHIQWQFGSDS